MKRFWVLLGLCICIWGMTTGCTKKEDATAEVPEIAEASTTKTEEVSMELQFSNETGESIYNVAVRPTDAYDWSENLVTDSAWKDRYELPIYINGTLPDIENGWQVKTINADGEETIWEEVSLEHDTMVRFIIEDETPFVVVQQIEES